MSKIDKKLLFMYAENARSKLKDLARQLKKSPQRLKYTLKVMEEEKLISCPHTIIDYSYFGQILFRVYFKGSYTGAKDKKEIIEKLRSNIYVVSIYELQGEFDLVMEIEAPNPSRFNKELKKKTLVISHGFKIPGWEKKLVNQLNNKPFPTYFYIKLKKL